MKIVLDTRTALIAAAAAATLGLAACNNPADDALEQQADATEQASDAAADALESQGLESQADAVEATGEAKADAIEDKADAVREAN
ncbi:hypothetical protein [Novosphingobium colocasiae]|uniref:hypothetical protein n=1 Tax=Novosphingobium colocasiae TaxID=1256513 RepID=UPI0035B14B38